MTRTRASIPAQDLELLSRNLERARWVAAAVTIPVCWLSWGVLVLYLNMAGMVVVAGILALTNLALVSHRSRRLGPDVDPGVRAIRLEVALALQLAADVVALSLAFWYLGGIETPVAFLGAYPVAAVASTIGRERALRVVAALVTGIGVVMMLEFNKAIYHFHIMNDWRWGVQKEWRYLLVYSGLLVAAWIAAAFIPRSRRTG